MDKMDLSENCLRLISSSHSLRFIVPELQISSKPKRTNEQFLEERAVLEELIRSVVLTPEFTRNFLHLDDIDHLIQNLTKCEAISHLLKIRKKVDKLEAQFNSIVECIRAAINLEFRNKTNLRPKIPVVEGNGCHSILKLSYLI